MALTSYALPSLLLHQWMSSSIIMHSFIVLLLCQCMNSLVYREKISLPPPLLCLSLTLSLSLFLLFHIFKCQLYLCGLWSFDVFSSSVSGFCVCEWELITKCSFRCFFFFTHQNQRSEKSRYPLLYMLYLFLPLHLSLQLFIFGSKCGPCVGLLIVLAVIVEEKNKEWIKGQGSAGLKSVLTARLQPTSGSTWLLTNKMDFERHTVSVFQ